MRLLWLPNRRRGEKVVTLDDLALMLHTTINLSDTVESVKWRLSWIKYASVKNIHFTINGKEIPNHAQLKDYLDKDARFTLRWSSPVP